jgi:YVTN family beta-propeller protein
MSRRILSVLPAATSISMLSSGATSERPSLGSLIVTNKGDQTVGIIDPVGGRQIATIPQGGVTGHELIASPDGRTAYVPIYGDSGVGEPGSDGRNMVVVDLAGRKVTGNVDFGHGVRPHCPMFGPKNGLLYVTTELDETVSIIDPKTLKIVGTIPTGQRESHMLAITPDGRYGYTANVGPGTVSVLDMEKKKTLKIIPISGPTQRISVSIDGKLAFTSDRTKPDLVVIDTATNEIKKRVTMPGRGYGSAPTPDGKYLVIAVGAEAGAGEEPKVSVIDLKTLKVAHNIDVPAAPQKVLIRPDGAIAYVSCDKSAKVAAIRVSDWKVDRLIDAGPQVDGLAWAR